MNRIRIYTLLALVLLFSPTIYGQINVKDSIQVILSDDSVDLNLRFTNARNLIFSCSLPEEAEELAMKVVYPFVQKNWDTESNQLARLARLYLFIGISHRERGGADRFEQE